VIPRRPDVPGVSSRAAATHDDCRSLTVSVVGFVVTLFATAISLVVFVVVLASGWDGTPASAGGPQPPDWVIGPWLWSAGIGTVALILDTVAYQKEGKRGARRGRRLTSVALAMCIFGATAQAILLTGAANAGM
jgi:hypothetical protein